MDFWNNKVGVSEDAARQQLRITSQFSSEKKSKIASDFLSFGVDGTRKWLKEKQPFSSELEISLEFVRTQYYESGEMPNSTWEFYKSKMEIKIKKDWISRFKKMMKERSWSYDDIAAMGGFKNGHVVKSTLNRGLPSFAKVAVLAYEKGNS